MYIVTVCTLLQIPLLLDTCLLNAFLYDSCSVNFDNIIYSITRMSMSVAVFTSVLKYI